MLVSGNLESVRELLVQRPELALPVQQFERQTTFDLTYSTASATDDWPYLYLERPGIPLIFFLMAGLMFLLFLRSLRHWEARTVLSGWDTDHWHFFFLGAAFLLLEVTNISRAAVVLGNTWLVNAVIVGGVLAMILVANLIASLFRVLPMRTFYFAAVHLLPGALLHRPGPPQHSFLPSQGDGRRAVGKSAHALQRNRFHSIVRADLSQG